MHTNPYKPPQTRVASNHPRSSNRTVWVARALAIFCFVTGVVRIVGIATASAKRGITMVTLYVSSAGPMLWCILGYLIYVRSRYALPGALIAIIVPYLLSPLAGLLVQSDLALAPSHFNYWHAVTTQVKATGMDWILFAAILLFTGWDYRERFASWRHE